ncbi:MULTISPECIES: helix-turn-helix domain-containing protein [unclassified Campylobacter]|uniref:helix-turn-helix domain-containing protein n=1 Tax=unclassified Campylobacter TaxID=2593542 RepID=UPI003D333424
MIREIFSKNIRKYRANLGISQEKLSELCDLHQTYISSIECNKRNVSIDNIEKIADALKIEPYKLFLKDV